LIQLAADLKARQERQQALDSELQALHSRISEWRAQHPQLDDAGLAHLLAFDEAAVSALRQQVQHSEKAIEQAKVLLQEREQRLKDH
ncbi:hypothetical protein O6482_25555, partial [Salmonella enterica subsp. enterica]